MTEADANRLKWQILDIVSEFFEKHFGENASDLEEQFTRQYDLLLEGHETEDISELPKLQNLIKGIAD